jgi:hypothetical protein
LVEGNNWTLPTAPGQRTTVTSIEGYPIAISSGANNSQINNHYYTSSLLKGGSITVGGGLIHKIDRFLDPFASSFGVSLINGTGKATVIDASPRQDSKTMTDLVLAEPQLSKWTAMITRVLPAILKRLSDRRGPEGGACTTPHPFAVLPNNDAVSLLPANYTKVLSAPFNFALSSHLLAWGISVPTCASFEDILKDVRTKGEFTIFSHRADLNLTIKETSRGSGELTVNNARVITANRCAGNGCIWIVDRLIDPVFGMF